MNNLNKIASDIAFLSNDDLARFALILAMNYPDIADKIVLELNYVKSLTI